MNILQVKVTDENAIALVNLVNAILTLRQHEKGGYVNLKSIRYDLTSEHIDYCLANGIEIERVPFFIELSPALKNSNVPAMFPNRTIPVYDEDGNVTGTRVLKIGEFFRYTELDSRFFIELNMIPKSDLDNNLSNIQSEGYLSASNIQTVKDTFTTQILSSYTEKEFEALKVSLTPVEE